METNKENALSIYEDVISSVDRLVAIELGEERELSPHGEVIYTHINEVLKDALGIPQDTYL